MNAMEILFHNHDNQYIFAQYIGDVRKGFSFIYTTKRAFYSKRIDEKDANTWQSESVSEKFKGTNRDAEVIGGIIELGEARGEVQ